MNALYQLKRQLYLRRKAKPVPMSLAAKANAEDKAWLFAYTIAGLIAVGLIVEQVYAYYAPVHLQMTTEFRK